MTLYHDSRQIFVGIVTTREKPAELGTYSYTAADFMSYLLRSSATYKFKKHNSDTACGKEILQPDVTGSTGGNLPGQYPIDNLIIYRISFAKLARLPFGWNFKLGMLEKPGK